MRPIVQTILLIIFLQIHPSDGIFKKLRSGLGGMTSGLLPDNRRRGASLLNEDMSFEKRVDENLSSKAMLEMEKKKNNKGFLSLLRTEKSMNGIQKRCGKSPTLRCKREFAQKNRAVEQFAIGRLKRNRKAARILNRPRSRGKRSAVYQFERCSQFHGKIKSRVMSVGAFKSVLMKFLRIGQNQGQKDADEMLLANYIGGRCGGDMAWYGKGKGGAARGKKRRKRRKKRDAAQQDSHHHNIYPFLPAENGKLKRGRRDAGQQQQKEEDGPPISAMRWMTHSVVPQEHAQPPGNDGEVEAEHEAMRFRSQSVIHQEGDGDAEVEHESSHDHKYQNDVNPDGTHKVNLHTTGTNKYKYAGDGTPPGFVPGGYGMSSFGHHFSGMEGGGGAYPRNSMNTKNNMKVRYANPVYGVSMNARHQFNAQHAMPTMPMQQRSMPRRPPAVMRPPAIPRMRRQKATKYTSNPKQAPTYMHGAYQGAYQHGPGYGSNFHTNYHHQMGPGPQYEQIYQNSHNFNNGGYYGDDDDDDDGDDEDDDDDEDDYGGIPTNYKSNHATHFSHTHGPGYHRSQMRMHHDIQMGHNPFVGDDNYDGDDDDDDDDYYRRRRPNRRRRGPARKRSSGGNFVGQLVAAIFVIFFIIIIIL